MSGGPSVNMAMALGAYNEYYRKNGRCYKRNRSTGETHETSFEDMLRSHQIARELIDEQRDYRASANEAMSEAKQIQRGLP